LAAIKTELTIHGRTLEIFKHAAYVLGLEMFVLIQRITQVFGRVVKFHIERIKNSTIYSVYVNALVDIQACLLEIETESVPHNVTQLLSLERIVQNYTLIRVLPKEFCIKEIGNIQLV
jgi:hypothetical protein